MDIETRLNDIRIASMNKAQALRNGDIGNSDQSWKIVQVALADIFDSLVTISWALNRQINPHGDKS